MAHIIIAALLTIATLVVIHLVNPNFFRKESADSEENDKS